MTLSRVTKILRCSAILVGLGLLLVASPVMGQQLPGGLEAGGTSYFTFSRPGQNTIEVIMLGDVGQSGLYRIGEDTDLSRLLALSGGPGGGNRGNTTVRLYRPTNGHRDLIFEAELDDFIAGSDAVPALETGDVIRVETSQGFDWRDTVRILTAVSSLTFTILRLFDIGR